MTTNDAFKLATEHGEHTVIAIYDEEDYWMHDPVLCAEWGSLEAMDYREDHMNDLVELRASTPIGMSFIRIKKETGMKGYDEEKIRLIETILEKQTRDQYTRKELETKSMKALKVIAEVID